MEIPLVFDRRITDAPEKMSRQGRVSILVLLALCVDLFTPFLIWKGVLPASVRWISHASVALMMAFAWARLLYSNRIPVVMMLMAAGSLMGICVAFLQGQGPLPTVWGWWVMVQFPMVGLFAYLQPRWPDQFPQRMRRLCIGVLALELMVQIGQYLTGERPGDNLAGTFGKNGTGNLVMFVLLVLCLALGQWIASQRWKATGLVLILAAISSVMGEMKFFLAGGLLLAGMAVALYLLRSRKVWQIVPCLLILGVAVIGFTKMYDQIVPGAKEDSLERFVRDPKALAKYLDFRQKEVGYGRSWYELGRNTALQLGWDAIRDDPTALLFGMGLGARGESRTLGAEGVGLGQGLGRTSNTSLLVMLQELGLIGMIMMAGLWVWVGVTLYKDIAAHPQSEAAELRYALLLCSLLWPLWLWYNEAWMLRVPMLLYWVALGYVLSEARRTVPIRVRELFH